MSSSGANATLDLSYVHWDELTAGDWAANVFVLIGVVFILAGVVVIAWKHKYPPIKAKQPALLIPLGLSGCITLIAVAHASRTLPQQGILLYNGGCSIVGLWMLFVFGLELSFVLLLFRLIRLFFVFNMKRVPPFWGQAGIFLVMFAYPVIGQGIVGTALGANGPTVIGGVPQCWLGQQLYYANIVYLVVLFLLFMFLAISLRNIPKRAFSDYRINVIIIVYLIVFSLIFLGMTLAHVNRSDAGRVAMSFVGLVMLVGTWLLVAGPILYHSLVHPEAHLVAFSNELANVSYVDKAAAAAAIENRKPSSKSSAAPQSPRAVSPIGVSLTNGSLELRSVHSNNADDAPVQTSLAESEHADV